MTHPRRFRFGVQLNQPLPGLDWAGTARRVEELGYSTLFLPDHFGDQLAPIAAMTAAAAATERLTVGTLVFDNDYRHPVVLAKEMATIDLLFGGRCEVGMGAGWMRSDYDSSGIPMDRPGLRVDRLIEAVAVVQGLWSEEAVTLAGDHYQVTGLEGFPRPHTPGGPPLILAGGSPRMLRFAGAAADIVGVNPSIHSGEVDADAARDGMADRMDRKLEWVREGAGERFDELEINAWVPVVVVTDDAEGVAAMLAPGFGLDAAHAGDTLESPMTMVGTEDEIVDRLLRRRERWGFSYHVVQNEAALTLAPIVQRLAGT
jgi:probable F420-dependent oxidoreductase